MLNKQYPGFKPYAMVYHKDSYQKIPLELISYPYSMDNNIIYINARTKDDPTTLCKYRIEDLELINHKSIWICAKCRIQIESIDLPNTWKYIGDNYFCDKCVSCSHADTYEREAPDGSMACICKYCDTVVTYKDKIPNCEKCGKQTRPILTNEGEKYECPNCYFTVPIKIKEKSIKPKCIKCKSTNTTYHHSEADRALHSCNDCGMNFYVYPPDKCSHLKSTHTFSIDGKPTHICDDCGKELDEQSIFTSGAKRSKDVDQYRYDLISPFAIKALASAYREGADKYPMWNCEKGFPVHDLFNHALGHIVEMMSGDWSEHNIGKIMWGFAMIVHEMHIHPEKNIDNHRSEGCIAPLNIKNKMWKEFKS